MGIVSRRARVALATLAGLACLAHSATAQEGQAPSVEGAAAKPAAAVAVDPPPAPPLAVQNNLAAVLQCDGYAEFRRSGDGITRQGAGIFTVAGDRLRRRPNFQNGVAYCDQAIARLDAEFPQFWMRKVSLTQSRAVHRLVAGDAAGALVDLDAADAAAAEPQNAHYLRSLGANTGFIRGFALIRTGDRAAGEGAVLATLGQRQFSRDAVTAAVVAVGPEATQATMDQLLRAAGRLDPSRSNALFLYLFETGRYAEALEVFPGLKPPVPIHNQTYDVRTQLQNAENQRASDEFFWQQTLGRKAFALAALGRAEEARAVLAETEARLEAATPEPAPLPPEPTNRDRIQRVVQEQANLDIRTRAPPIRQAWSGLTEARIAAGEGRAADARRAIADLSGLPITYAVLDVYRTANPRAADVSALESGLPRDRLGLPTHDPRLLLMQLLDAEDVARASARVGALDRIFMSRDGAARGGCNENQSDVHEPSWVLVCFRGFDATLAITEERALLRAANRGAERGATHFIIEWRFDIQHSVVNTMYGVTMSEQQTGFESRLQVRYLTEAPADCWRCISVAEVQSALGPVYAAAEANRQRRR